MGHTKWTDLKERHLAAMSPEQRSRSEAAQAAMRLAFDVGEKVRDARERAGLSQRELATRMGASQSTVVRLEAGGASVTLTTLQKVASALDLNVTVKFDDSDFGESEYEVGD